MAENDTGNVGTNGNGTERSGSKVATKGGIRIKPPIVRIEPITESAAESAGNTHRSTTASESRQRRTTKATVTVSHSQPVQQAKPAGSVKPDQSAPTESKPRKRNEQPSLHLSVTDAKNTADYLLSAIEVCGVVAAGPAGEMTEFERGLIGPPLQRILARTPVAMIERTTPLLDFGVLLIGGTMYMSRVMKGVKLPSAQARKPQVVHEDMQAPAAAPVEQTITRQVAGDIDGLAMPVPDVLHMMNGVI